MKYTTEEILSNVDLPLLNPEATWPQIPPL